MNKKILMLMALISFTLCGILIAYLIIQSIQGKELLIYSMTALSLNISGVLFLMKIKREPKAKWFKVDINFRNPLSLKLRGLSNMVRINSLKIIWNVNSICENWEQIFFKMYKIKLKCLYLYWTEISYTKMRVLIVLNIFIHP